MDSLEGEGDRLWSVRLQPQTGGKRQENLPKFHRGPRRGGEGGDSPRTVSLVPPPNALHSDTALNINLPDTPSTPCPGPPAAAQRPQGHPPCHGGWSVLGEDEGVATPPATSALGSGAPSFPRHGRCRRDIWVSHHIPGTFLSWRRWGPLVSSVGGVMVGG